MTRSIMLKDLQLDFIAARQEVKRLFEIHLVIKTEKSLNNWKSAKIERKRINKLIQNF